MTKTKRMYVKELEKWCKKELAHIKRPTKRKRDLVKRMAFAIISRHKKEGFPTVIEQRN